MNHANDVVIKASRGEPLTDADRLVFLMGGKQNWAGDFVRFVIMTGGDGDIVDCRRFIDSRIGVKQGS